MFLGCTNGNFTIPHCRYGPKEWSPWRKVGTQMLNGNPTYKLPLGTGRISGYSVDNNGTLHSIVTISPSGKKNVGGINESSLWNSLRISPPTDGTPVALTHLSGDQERDNWTLCFHYE